MEPHYDWSHGGRVRSTTYIAEMLLEELPPPPARVLDLGSGNGFTSGILSARGYSVTGVDPSDTGVTIARKEHPGICFLQGSASDDLLSKTGNQPFDVVVSTEVVEHVYDPHEWARCCAHCLPEGGLLLATTPHHGFTKNLLLSLTNGWDKHWGSLVTGGHIKFWSVKTLTTLLTEAGFRVDRSFGVGRTWPVWASLVVRATRM